MKIRLLPFSQILFSLLLAPLSFGETADRWWPTQKVPKKIVRTSPEGRAALQMLMQSVSGLAAKAVNENRGDELVWINNGPGDQEKWLAGWMSQQRETKTEGELAPWDLVNHFATNGIIKGYILYRADHSKGELNSYRAGIDCSVNIATSLAGLLDGVIVSEELEAEAKQHGLKQLSDVRHRSQQWCFQTYSNQFNRRMLCTQDPRKPHTRDFAIAQKAFVLYGQDEPLNSALAWLEPLSPILGWNGGDEFLTTDLSSAQGHIQTATDWCMNLPVLSAGSENAILPQAKTFDPRALDWNDTRSAVSFIGTDGDNVQWLQGNFFHHPSYWAAPERGRIPYGWSACFDHLAQLCPPAIEYAMATRRPDDSFVEWGGGYYFPDHFGSARANRWDLLAQHARRTWALMKLTNTRMAGFNFARLDSNDARKACEVFASQTDALLAIFAFQYAPYEGGAGKVFWVKDSRGVDLPVITARYSIWENSNRRERAGTPAKIARVIRETAQKTPSGERPRYDWVIAHAWSYFKKSPGSDENAENLPQERAEAAGGVRGYLPVTWCAERLPAEIRVVSPEELAWRIRMKHDPLQTEKLINSWK